MGEPLGFNEYSAGKAIVIELKGRFDASVALPVKNRMRSLLDDTPFIIADLGQISFIDSSGLGALLASLRHASRRGGDLRLANMTEKIQQVFALIRLDHVFKIYPDVKSAVQSLKE